MHKINSLKSVNGGVFFISIGERMNGMQLIKDLHYK